MKRILSAFGVVILVSLGLLLVQPKPEPSLGAPVNTFIKYVSSTAVSADVFCLTGDLPCRSTWPTGTGGGGSSFFNGFMTSSLYITDGSTTSTLRSSALYLTTSTANMLGLFNVDSGGNTSVSGTLKVFGGANFGNLTATNIFGTNVSSTFTSSTYSSSTILTTGNLTVLSGLSFPANSITDAMVANDITASNYLLLTGGTLTGGLSFTSMSGSNFFATNVSSTFASSTYTSTTALTAHAFFQNGLTDCSADNQALNYTLATGLITCGDDDNSGGGVNDWNRFGTTFNTSSLMTSSTRSVWLDGSLFVSSSAFFTGLQVAGNLSASSTLTVGGLSFFSSLSTFTSGFISSASSSIGGGLQVSGVLNASSTLLIGGTTQVGVSTTAITNGGLEIGRNNTTFRKGFFAVDATAGSNGATSVSGTLKVFSSSTFTTTTLTGGLFQNGLTDCSTDTQSLSYTLSTGLFGCGDDDTGGSSTVSTTNAQASHFTDVTPANFADNNTTELWNDSTRPNITPQSANNPVMVNVSYMVRGASTADQSIVVRVVRENDPGSTTPTCDLTSDVQVGASVNGGGTLISAFTTNFTDNQAANGTILDFPATTTAVYYTVCTSASSTVTVAPTSTALYVGLTEIQGAGSGPPREYTRIYTESTTWTKPVTSTGFIGVRVWCVGGGGGGGGAGTAGQIGGGGGGGGAAYRYVTSSLMGGSLSVTVGAAGAGGAAGNNDGTAGGTSSFNSLLTCTGGGAGQDGASGASVAAGGVGSGGAVNGTGRDGREPGTYTDSYRGIGGAAGADQGDTQDLAGSYYHSLGADGILGQWAGAGGVRPGEWDANSRNGSAGASYGGGGSGGQKVGAGADASGGAGKSGIVVITELYN